MTEMGYQSSEVATLPQAHDAKAEATLDTGKRWQSWHHPEDRLLLRTSTSPIASLYLEQHFLTEHKILIIILRS